MCVFGTRPEGIKMAPIIKAMKKRPEIETVICITAQHRSMLDQVLNLFEIEPDYDLNIFKPGQSLTEITTRAIKGLEEVILKAKKGEKKQYDIIFLGRLTYPKNPIAFIDIIKEIHNDIPNLRVAMIGTGELGDKCKKRIDNLSLNGNIDLLGFMDNPYGILSQSKVLCMTSLWEGFGLVAVEALSLGIPVVANPVGGLLGIVNDSCGFLTSDNIEYIDEVKKLVLDDNYRREKSEFALLRANELNNAKEYISIIENLYKNVGVS